MFLLIFQHDPEPDEGEYYDRDNPDVEQKDSEYMLQYHNDEMMGKQDQARPGSMGVVPEIHDYSLKENFKQLFKSSPGVRLLHKHLLCIIYFSLESLLSVKSHSNQ